MPVVVPHLKLKLGDIPPYVLLPGDPARLDHIAEFLTNPREIAYNREFRTLTGEYKGVSLAAVSTGIGGPSAAIAVEELVQLKAHTLIRIGSAGGLQPGQQIGDLVIPCGVVREDGTSATYVDARYPAVPHPEVLRVLVELAGQLQMPFHVGITRSHDSFYTSREEEITTYWHRLSVIASDMETATLFVVGSLRRVRTGSVLNIVVPHGGDATEGINNLTSREERALAGEKNEIRLALEALATLAVKDREG